MKQDSFSYSIYGQSLSLLTDLYELTMAYGYWKEGIADRMASFYLSFRKKPFQGAYAVVAGLETFIGFLESFRFDQSDILYLRSVQSSQGAPLFEEAFLTYLQNLRFSCDIDAMPEGTVCFPQEPMIRVTGPILQGQLIESALLNIINFQTLIATKASRVCYSAHPDPVIEFGLRRAQGIDGALAASRAAFIGGCSGTSNTLAAKLFGIPVVGTHAHSWIMAFDDERSAFTSFAKALPDSCVFLIDTYNTIEGVKNAIAVAQEMKKSGHQMIGVRLDSGDLAKLSIQVRNLLDQAGLQEAKIMASNELDEYVIRDLKQQGCKITIWGVGTNLVTGKEQPALDGVYKLSAIQNSEKKWDYKLKVSEQWAKVTNPGLLQVKRFYLDNIAVADSIYDLYQSPSANEFIDVFNPSNQQVKNPKWTEKDLLVPIMRQGVVVYEFPTLDQVRAKAAKELETIPLEARHFLNPQAYCVGLEKTLYHLKLRLLQAFRDRLC